MTVGDCFIITSDFHKMQAGLIFIGENKRELFFTPLNFKDHKFNNTIDELFEGKLQTNKILSGNFGIITGIIVIHESKKKPSFLTSYCNQNKPFITLNLDTDKIVLEQGAMRADQIIIGGGKHVVFETKKEFDKLGFYSLLNAFSKFDLSELSLILESK